MIKLRQITMRSAFALALSLTGVPLAAQEADPKTVVAVVNGVDITLGNMIAMRAELPPEYDNLDSAVLFEGILNQLIQQVALVDSVKEITLRDQVVLENERRSYLSSVILGDVVAKAVTPEAVQAAYDARYKTDEAQQEYNAAHILVKTEDEAKAIVAELKAGAKFEELAQEKSIDAGSGANGGDLGWFAKGAMVKAFEDAVVSAKTGEVTGPIESQFGWHVIMVKATRVLEAPPLADVEAELSAQVQRAAVDAHIAALMAEAKVERLDKDLGIAPEVLAQQDLLTQK